jgi:excisionase family DNA binding protein
MEDMDVKAVSKYTHLSPRTIYNLVSTKKIPFKRLSEKKVIFIKDDIDEWMKRREDGKKSRKIPKKQIHFEEDSVQISAPLSISGERKPKGLSPQAKRNFQFGVLAIVLISIGWGGGFFFVKSRSQRASFKSSTPNGIDIETLIDHAKINSLDFSQSAANESNIQVKLDYLSQVVELEGTISSPQIKPFLVHALEREEDNYAIKSKTIDAFEPYFLDPEIRQAIIHILAHERDPIIRMKAVTVLAKVAKTEEIKKALLERLNNDENMGIRFKVLELIENFVDEEVIEVLRILREKEKEGIIKNKVEAIFQKYKNYKQKT